MNKTVSYDEAMRYIYSLVSECNSKQFEENRKPIAEEVTYCCLMVENLFNTMIGHIIVNDDYTIRLED